MGLIKMMQSGEGASGGAKATGLDEVRPARAAISEEEEKGMAPEHIQAIVKHADELFDQEQHAQTREYLKNQLPKYPPSVEMVRSASKADLIVHVPLLAIGS
jgi:hypothetical protein